MEDNTIEFITPDLFIPIEFDAQDRLIDVIFVERKPIGELAWYLRLERHALHDETLTITNTAYKTTDLDSFGNEVPLDSVGEWADLEDEITYEGVERPDFGYYRNPIKNLVDGSACGVSIFDSAIEQIQDADEQYAGLKWEYKSGERAIHASPEAFAPGSDYLDSLDSRLYRKLGLEMGDGKDLFDVFSPDFRDQSLLNGFNAYLRRIEFNVGLAYGDLSDVQDVEKTATEIAAAKKRKFNTIKAIQDNLKDCLEDLVYALAFYNDLTGSGYEFSCEFHDSILTDEDAENASMREDVAAGMLRPEIYLAKRYGVTEEEALSMMPSSGAIDDGD
jgi:A118 family predicted phage portal protein